MTDPEETVVIMATKTTPAPADYPTKGGGGGKHASDHDPSDPTLHPTAQETMIVDMARYWPAFIVRGIVAFSLGFLMLVFPNETVDMLSILIGIVFLSEAISAAVQIWGMSKYVAASPARSAMMTLHVFSMLANIGIGVFVLVFPDITAKILLLLAAVWFVMIGVLHLLLGCILKCSSGSGNVANLGMGCCVFLAGMLYVAFGTVLLTDLDEGMITFAKFMGGMIMLFAVQIIFMGCQLRSVHVAHNRNNGNSSGPHSGSFDAGTARGDDSNSALFVTHDDDKDFT